MAVIVIVRLLRIAFGGMVKVKRLPLASVTLSSPPDGPMLAVALRVASSTGFTVTGVPEGFHGRTSAGAPDKGFPSMDWRMASADRNGRSPLPTRMDPPARAAGKEYA